MPPWVGHRKGAVGVEAVRLGGEAGEAGAGDLPHHGDVHELVGVGDASEVLPDVEVAGDVGVRVDDPSMSSSVPAMIVRMPGPWPVITESPWMQRQIAIVALAVAATRSSGRRVGSRSRRPSGSSMPEDCMYARSPEVRSWSTYSELSSAPEAITFTGSSIATGTTSLPFSTSQVHGVQQLGAHLLQVDVGEIEQLQPAPLRFDLDGVADVQQLVHLGVEVDQDAGVLTDHDPFGAGGEAGGDDRFVPDAGEVVEGVVDAAVAVVDGGARFDVVPLPTEGGIADADVVDVAVHPRADDGEPVVVGEEGSATRRRGR
jgi:hypothetical protein